MYPVSSSGVAQYIMFVVGDVVSIQQCFNPEFLQFEIMDHALAKRVF